MILRDWQERDHEALLDLWQESWQAAMPHIDFAARRPWFAGHLRQLMANGTRLRLALDVDDAPLGFYTLDALGYFDQFAVRRGRWGSGVAAVLIDDAKRHAPRQITLKVNQANGRAIAFYAKHGFERIAADVNPLSGLPLWVYRWQA